MQGGPKSSPSTPPARRVSRGPRLVVTDVGEHSWAKHHFRAEHSCTHLVSVLGAFTPRAPASSGSPLRPLLAF